MLKIKNWKRFQHFKDRKPPWVKLYHDLLDDIKWHELDPEAAKHLVMMWLIASENDGCLPPLKELSFRLRVSKKVMESTVSKLSHWLVQDDISVISDDNLISEQHQEDINAISTRYPSRARGETETETETDTPIGFDIFYEAYPKKVGKPAALKAWKAQKINGECKTILADIEAKMVSDKWLKNNGEFIPNPATYLNQRRWEDVDQNPQPDRFI
jgi:hypothetical protein